MFYKLSDSHSYLLISFSNHTTPHHPTPHHTTPKGRFSTSSLHFQWRGGLPSQKCGIEGLIPLVYIRRPSKFLIWDPQISSISSDTPQYRNPILQFVAHYNMQYDLHVSLSDDTGKTCEFIDSPTTISAPKSKCRIKYYFNCTSAQLIHYPISETVNMLCFISLELEDLSGEGLVNTGVLSLVTILTNVSPDNSNSCNYSVSNIKM